MLNYLVQESDRWKVLLRQKDMSAKNGSLPKKQVETQFGEKFKLVGLGPIIYTVY